MTKFDTSYDKQIGDNNEITILCELIGARNLRLRDDDEITRGVNPNTLYPYCLVKYDGTRIHKTCPSEEQGCNPIWTPYSTKSLFLLKTTPREMSRCTMIISLYTKEESVLPSLLTTVTSAFLGQVHIDSNTILSHCDEERFELNIEDELGEQISNLGKLAVRFRVATPSDAIILNSLSKNSQKQKELISAIPASSSTTADIFQKTIARKVATLITEKDDSEIAQTNFLQSVGNIFTAQTGTCAETGLKTVRAKPCPDPDRPKETEFLRPQNIKLETRSPSSSWVEAGSGSLGRLFVEILSCKDLPNLDSAGVIGDFTDSFCTLVYEDTVAMTDVIYDELSPHWLPWTNRAFCFNVIHPASILYLGVFDFDLVGNHDPIGRVAVNVSNLQRDTVHTLRYNLYPSSNITDREAAGSITIRIRLEWFDPRAALLAALKPRLNMHVNVSKEKSFRVIRYVCFGEYDVDTKFDLTVTRSYINEILGHKSVLSYTLSDAFRSLILWRGQVEIFSIMVPLHSMILFILSLRLVEKPQLIVPYFLLGVAWVMLANLTVRRQHPSPWQSRLSFLDYVNILRTGKSSIPVKRIKEFEGAEAALAYELAWKKRVDKDRKMAEKKAELLQEINNIGDVNIHTKVSQQGVIPLDLLLRLGRYQGIIGRLCEKFRFVRIILTWEESVISFWVTAIFLTAGIVALILPWGFILTWIGRIFVWGCLGPHMKIVDLILRANERKDGGVSDLIETFDIQSNRARLNREEALKVKDIKEIAFGKYSVQVPCFNLSRHYDRPLPESSSRIYRKIPHRCCVRSNRRVSVTDLGKKDPLIPGQQLYGTMIPRPEFDDKVHQNEIIIAEMNLNLFQSCIKQINDTDGLSEYERKQLTKLDILATNPMAVGYEVIPYDIGIDPPSRVPSIDTDCEEITSESRTFQKSRRLTVKLTADKPGYIDSRETNDLILESDGKNTYCVSENFSEVEEEGMEVIGIGRFQSSSLNDGYVDGELVAIDSHDPYGVENRLSSIFSHNDNIKVICYRPPT
mmetsp:Transcript_25709/g.28797  ORF Transcript_25709/g.28797 Transcript_25709/m.28797 type:complete len:1027 (-) Transcript_25709:81-3161(-)